MFSILQQEKSAGELQPLQHDFYALADRFISTLGEEQTPESNRVTDNARKILVSLKERRKQKILLYIAYSKPLPASVPEEEENIYNEIFQILNRTGNSPKIARLKITSDIPEVLTSGGRKIGPYKQGEIVEVSDTGDADFIIKNRIGETTA